MLFQFLTHETICRLNSVQGSQPSEHPHIVAPLSHLIMKLKAILRPKRSILMACASIAILAALVGCGDKAEPGLNTTQARPVKLLTLDAAARMDSVTFPARIRAANSVTLSFNQPGELQRLEATQGLPVTAGTLLAQIDNTEATARFDTAEANFNLASSQLESARKLAASGALSTAQLDQSESRFVSARAQLDEARKRLADTELRAPFDGVVSMRMVDNFTSVQAKQPIVRFESLQTLEALIDLSESQVLQSPREHSGITGFLSFASLPEQKLPAAFKEFVANADTASQTYQAVFSFAQPNAFTVLPGMSASLTLKIHRESAAQRFHIPPLAVLADPSGRHFVWRFNPSAGTVQKTEVTVGALSQAGLEIIDGLSEGDRIAVAGMSQLRDGMAVRPL